MAGTLKLHKFRPPETDEIHKLRQRENLYHLGQWLLEKSAFGLVFATMILLGTVFGMYLGRLLGRVFGPL